MVDIYSLYHACRQKDKGNYSEGYIGVSGDVEQRIRSHKTPKGSRCKRFMEAMNKYNDIVFYVVFEGTETECFDLEYELRPEINIGWNMFAGGKNKAEGYPTKWSEEAKKRVSGVNSHLRKGTYFTPDGIFYTCVSVGKHYNISKSTVQVRCIKGGIIGKSRWHGPDVWGKTWKELGWYYIEGVDNEND